MSLEVLNLSTYQLKNSQTFVSLYFKPKSMEHSITIVTLVTGIVTIIWFIRDVRKQNSKVLKSMLDVQRGQADVLVKIEEGH